MIRFSREKVLLLHQLMAQATGGSVGLRDEALLDAALESAFAGFGDVEFYPSKEEKGARLGYELISNHAFVDGDNLNSDMVKENPDYVVRITGSDMYGKSKLDYFISVSEAGGLHYAQRGRFRKLAGRRRHPNGGRNLHPHGSPFSAGKRPI